MIGAETRPPKVKAFLVCRCAQALTRRSVPLNIIATIIAAPGHTRRRCATWPLILSRRANHETYLAGIAWAPSEAIIERRVWTPEALTANAGGLAQRATHGEPAVSQFAPRGVRRSEPLTGWFHFAMVRW